LTKICQIQGRIANRRLGLEIRIFQTAKDRICRVTTELATAFLNTIVATAANGATSPLREKGADRYPRPGCSHAEIAKMKDL
jgi:hypothetical protein